MDTSSSTGDIMWLIYRIHFINLLVDRTCCPMPIKISPDSET